MSDTTFLSWPRGEIPPSYSPISWQDRLERGPQDYDGYEPYKTPREPFLDLERDAEYMLSLSTF